MIWDRKTAPPEAVDGIPLPEGGYRLQPYDDGFGNPTIGAGSLHMPDGSPVTPHSRVISLAEARALFAAALVPCVAGLAAAVAQPLFTGQAAGLISLLYNCGAHQLAGSVIARMIAAGRLDLARLQLAGWCEARDAKTHVLAPSLGLMRRRLFDQLLWDGAAPIAATREKAWLLQLPAGMAAYHQAMADAKTWGWAPTPAAQPGGPAAPAVPHLPAPHLPAPRLARVSDDSAATDALNAAQLAQHEGT